MLVDFDGVVGQEAVAAEHPVEMGAQDLSNHGLTPIGADDVDGHPIVGEDPQPSRLGSGAPSCFIATDHRRGAKNGHQGPIGSGTETSQPRPAWLWQVSPADGRRGPRRSAPSRHGTGRCPSSHRAGIAVVPRVPQRGAWPPLSAVRCHEAAGPGCLCGPLSFFQQSFRSPVRERCCRS